MNTISAPPLSARPFPLLALALGVLLAHALLLAWLLFTPTPPPDRPEQRLEWVTLQKPPPSIEPAQAPHEAAHEPPPPPSRPAPRPHTAPARPEPQRQPAHQTEPARAKVPPPVEAHAAVAPTARPAVTLPATPNPAPAELRTTPPAQTEAVHTPARPETLASAPTAAPPVVETAASYQANYLDNPPPTYPQLSRQLGEEGTALLKVQVGPDGRPLQIRLMSSTGFPRLDESAEATVAQWRFVAATRNGQSITSWVLVPIKFRILN
ncbi:MAG: TonB family protein [Thiomonas sp.]|nr:TonB family protein [Thiomonas sp.]